MFTPTTTTGPVRTDRSDMALRAVRTRPYGLFRIWPFGPCSLPYRPTWPSQPHRFEFCAWADGTSFWTILSRPISRISISGTASSDSSPFTTLTDSYPSMRISFIQDLRRRFVLCYQSCTSFNITSVHRWAKCARSANLPTLSLLVENRPAWFCPLLPFGFFL